MKTIGAFAAKTHFSQLLEQVTKGKEIIITKNGHKVAKLVPIHEDFSNDNPVHEAIIAIKQLRKTTSLGKNLRIKALIEEGRS